MSSKSSSTDSLCVFLHPSFKDPTGMAMFASMARKERHTWRKLREQMEQMRVAPFEACACAGKGVFDDNLRVIVHAYLMLFDCLLFNYFLMFFV